MGYPRGFNVAPIGRVGGLSLWWEDLLEVKVGFSSKHIIDVRFRVVGDDLWARATWVYGTAYRAEKSVFWSWMRSSFGPSNLSWFCGGDFNDFLWDYEKSGGSYVLYNRPRYLEEFMNNAELITWHGFRNG